VNSDTYITIKAPAEGLYKEKGSRFVSLAVPVSNQEEIKPIIDKIRKDRHEARHHCFAYMIGHERLIWRVSDDGEPSGTAGKPILGQINSHDLTNILIVVSRYFGGTLLGVSGLINAYKTASASAIANAQLTEKNVREYYEIIYPYISMNDVMKILKEENIVQTQQSIDNECRMLVNFRVSVKDKVLHRLSRIEGLICTYIETY
jgi:uncharacterized YigZ family protein